MSFQAPTGLLQANSPIVIGWGVPEGSTSVNITGISFTLTLWKGSYTSKTVLDTILIDRGSDIDSTSLIVNISPYIQSYINATALDLDSDVITDSQDGNVIGCDIVYSFTGSYTDAGGTTYSNETNASTPRTIFVSSGYSRFEDGVNHTTDSIFLNTPRTILIGTNTKYFIPVRGGASRNMRFTYNGQTLFNSYSNSQTSEGNIFYLPVNVDALSRLGFDPDAYTATGTVTDGQIGYDGLPTAFVHAKTSEFQQVSYDIDYLDNAVFSIYVKQASFIDLAIVRFNLVAGGNASVEVDVNLGIIERDTTGLPLTLESVGNGWYKLTVDLDGSIDGVDLRMDISQPVGTMLWQYPALDILQYNTSDIKVESLDDNGVVDDTINISYEDCFYEEGQQLMYLNRNGAWDTLALLGRTTESSSFSSDNYKSSIGVRSIESVNGITYSAQDHTYRRFNQTSRKNYTVNTGWVSENNYNAIEDVMMSPRVFLVTDLDADNATLIPVIPTDSSVTKQTHKHDKNISYTLNLVAANDSENRIL